MAGDEKAGDEKAKVLRHFLAALAYRTQKALRDAPDDFADFEAGNKVRTPKVMVRHMTSVLGYARTFFRGGAYRPEPLETLEEEVGRFHEMLADLVDHLEKGDSLSEVTPERILQGPFADAMTHAGQLAMLRRLHGSPVRSENFVFADIDASNVGEDQPPPAMPNLKWRKEL